MVEIFKNRCCFRVSFRVACTTDTEITLCFDICDQFTCKTIYFGPMGCRTGFYLLLAGDYESKDIVGLMIEMFEFIRDFKGDVPGASPKDCGNYLDMNLGMANYLANRYLENTLYHIDEKHLVYPE